MAKKYQNAKLGFGVDDPIDAIHMGEGKRIRLEDVPEEGSTGDQQVGNREYNDARYQPKGEEQATVARWIIPPVVQWTGSGYIFSTSQCSYELPGSASPIVANPTSKNLSSPDASFDRFDLFVWNDAGECVVIEGTPATEPIVPVVADPLTQIAGPFVLVKTGTTEPDPVDLTNTVIYNENTEWTGSAVGCTANFNNGVPVFTGFKSLEVSAIAINDYIEFTAPTDFNPLTFDSFGFQLRLKASMLTNQNLGIRFYDVSNVAISNERNITIEKGLVNEWQLSAVNIDSFAFNSNNARKIRIRWTRGTINHAGFYLDLVQLQGGIVPPVVAGTVVLTGQVEGSGVTGTPINVTVTEKFISDQTEQTDPLPANAMTTFRLSTGDLVKVPASLLFALGEDGREIELQVNATHIQWRYVGDPAWTDLIALTAITGPQGPAGANGTNGTDGREVELQVSGTNLQWRYVGDVSWTTIFDLSTLGGGGSGLPAGGTTGQVLTKNSSTDGDADWQDLPASTSDFIQPQWNYTSKSTVAIAKIGAASISAGATVPIIAWNKDVEGIQRISNAIRLTKGGRYKLTAIIKPTLAASSEVEFRFVNVTDADEIDESYAFDGLGGRSYHRSDGIGDIPSFSVIVEPEKNITVDLRVRIISGSITNLDSASIYSRIIVERISESGVALLTNIEEEIVGHIQGVTPPTQSINQTSQYIYAGTTDGVAKINLGTGKIEKFLQLADHIGGVCYLNGYIYAVYTPIASFNGTNISTSKIYEISPVDLSIIREVSITSDFGFGGIGTNGTELWVCYGGDSLTSGKVRQINPTTLAFSGSVIDIPASASEFGNGIQNISYYQGRWFLGTHKAGAGPDGFVGGGFVVCDSDFTRLKTVDRSFGDWTTGYGNGFFFRNYIPYRIEVLRISQPYNHRILVAQEMLLSNKPDQPTIVETYSDRIRISIPYTYSENGILKYIIYLNGIYHSEQTSTLLFITGLTNSTLYDLEISIISDNYIESEKSNTLSFSTNEVIFSEPSVPQGANLRAYWKFDEAIGTTATDSKNSLVATLFGNSTFISGKINNGIDFDGVNDYCTIPNNSLLRFSDGSTSDEPFSVAFWVNFKDTSATYFIAKDAGGANREYLFAWNGSVLTVILYDTGSNFIRANHSYSITTNTWVHLAVTYNGSGLASGLKIYVNGSAVSISTSSSGTYVCMKNVGGDIDINRSRATTGDGNIVMDELGIWGVELTPAEIAEIYNLGDGLSYNP